MTRRTERIAQRIRHEVGAMIMGLNDPRIGFVTITRVDVAADLGVAKVFVSILETPARQKTTLEGLNSARRRMQNELGDQLGLRRTPELIFMHDPGVKHSIRISKLLHDLAVERGDATDEAASEEPLSEEKPDEESEEPEESDENDR